MKYEIYKNSPLVETVFEIRFPGEPAVECQRDKLFEKIKNIYPVVRVPKSFQDRAIALDPYSFETKDGTNGVMVAINRLSIFCKKYTGFNNFKAEILRVTKIFNNLFHIENINRTGLRYINLIPFRRENSIIPINDYIKIKVNLPEAMPSSFKNISIAFVSETGKGNITTRIEPILSKETKQETLLLDFDYVKESQGKLRYSCIEEYLNESHLHTKKIFEELMTDNYKKFMRGEVI